MNVLNRNINNIFFIFVLSHLVIWTVVPTLTNKNLPLDTIEALAWGSNLEWGFNKHPPVSAFFPELFFQIFGSQDWAYYLLSQIFVVTALYYVFKFAYEIFGNNKLSLISVFLLSSSCFHELASSESSSVPTPPHPSLWRNPCGCPRQSWRHGAAKFFIHWAFRTCRLGLPTMGPAGSYPKS